ncbi:hypothetical protein [Belliella pelovolcani]|uniref:CarboxypepD_reg-like domain-containing protein n=1 Tax=Belliella pelovolcani TaxID=529505 RepID=A0A1N7MPH6_9BACT|nr:hypothetical protein [Belliella pelovolcani]SIS88044.1 hypothetical protein SAMN05421761_10718 [Belliella pelovolcani]
MKKILLIISFFVSFGSLSKAQTITGNVIDGLDKGYLDQVWVVNLTNQDSAETNMRGYFRIKGSSGDSLVFKRQHYIPAGKRVGEQTHFVMEIYLNARLLPRFDVYAKEYRIPFSMDGTASPTGMRGLTDRPAGPGKIYSGMSDNPGLMPALTIDGPISYFMKSERQKRQYARRLAEIARQQDYLDLIQSDSVMIALKKEYNLTDKDLDDLIIEFNLQNISHQFKDMNTKMVEQRLLDFFDRKTGRKY